MNARTAQILGGVAGMLAVVTWLVVRRVGPPPCTGGVFVELSPPLTRPGLYRFELTLDDAAPCAFVVPLPTDRAVDTSACGVELALSTEADGARSALVRLAIGAAPSRLGVRVWHGEQIVIDSVLRPSYSEYLAPREEGASFCGRRATVTPPCVRGAVTCQPFPAACDGPEDCRAGEACCASVEWARVRGADAATACLTERRCLARYADVVCHSDGDCPRGMRCDDAAVRGEFRPELAVCRPAGSR